jgi:putative ABC transport system permease protein
MLSLALILINKRTKEIGIRKVNGAKITEILTLPNKDFVIWAVIAFILATPIKY